MKVRVWSPSRAGQLRFLLCLCLLNNEGKGNVFHVLLTVSGSSCPAFDCRCSSMQRELSLSLHQHKNKSKHQYRSKSISVAQQHIYTKQTQIATSRFPTLADDYSGVYSCRRCMDVRYMQTKLQKRKTRKQERPNRGRFQLFFHHPFIGCAYQGVKQGAKQCMCCIRATCRHVCTWLGSQATKLVALTACKRASKILPKQTEQH